MTRREARIKKTIRKRRMRIGTSLIAAGIVAAAGLVVAPAVANINASAATGIFADDLRPQTPSDPDRRAVELGVRFSPQKAGSVTALQYYQGPRTQGVQLATLWSASGKVLATVSFSPSAKVGWRTVPLRKPVPLAAHQTYVVSYHAPKGGYPVTEHDLAKPRTQNGFSLTANAGVYRYGSARLLPTKTYKGSNYFADVVFTPGAVTGGTGTPAASTPTWHPSPTKTVTPTPSPTKTNPPAPGKKPLPPKATTPRPSPIPTKTSAPAPVSPPAAPPASAGAFPTASTTGLPSGWKPAKQVTGDYWVRTAGAVVEDLQITNGTIHVAAKNVTLRRISGIDASVINQSGSTCYNGMTIEDSRFVTKGKTDDSGSPVIGSGGYTVRNVLIDGAPEGLRVGGKSAGCGTVTVQDSFVRIASPDVCNDWHGDGIQGYDGAGVVVRNSTIVMNETNGCYGTAPFFYPAGQGNTSVDIDGLLLSGGGYSFRDGMPGSVKNLKVVDGEWGYGPISVKCSTVSNWQASVVRLNASGQPTTVRAVGCTTETDG